MKTLVVFEVSGGLVSLGMSDLVLAPSRSSSYVLDGKLFEVTDIVECLGRRHADGRVKSGDELLLDLLGVIYADPGKAASMLSGMKDLSSESAGTAAAGGLVIVEPARVSSAFDSVLFVRLKASRKQATQAALTLGLGDLAGTRHELAAGNARKRKPRSEGGKRRRGREVPQ